MNFWDDPLCNIKFRALVKKYLHLHFGKLVRNLDTWSSPDHTDQWLPGMIDCDTISLAVLHALIFLDRQSSPLGHQPVIMHIWSDEWRHKITQCEVFQPHQSWRLPTTAKLLNYKKPQGGWFHSIYLPLFVINFVDSVNISVKSSAFYCHTIVCTCFLCHNGSQHACTALSLAWLLK